MQGNFPIDRPTASSVAVSVIIATRNRCDSLARCLDALTRLDVPRNLCWELVVVDNGSTDATGAVLASYADRLPLCPIRESAPGISAARNAGLRAARGRVLALTDDDCIVDRQWLAVLWQEFTRDPALAGVGGRVELYDPNDRSISIRAGRERLAFDSPYQLFTLIIGCNMAFTRWAIDKLGEFDPYLGAGTRVRSGEDVDYLYRALVHGLKMMYVPEMLIYHNHGRRTDAEIRRLTRNYAIGRGAFYCKHLRAHPREVIRCLSSELRWEFGQIASAIRERRSIRSHIESLWYLLVGAIHRLTPTQRASR